MKNTFKYILFAVIINFTFLINAQAETANTCEYIGMYYQSDNARDIVNITTQKSGNKASGLIEHLAGSDVDYKTVVLTDSETPYMVDGKVWTSEDCPKWVLYETKYFNSLYVSNDIVELTKYATEKNMVTNKEFISLSKINSVSVSTLESNDSMICCYGGTKGTDGKCSDDYDYKFYVDHTAQKVDVDDDCDKRTTIDYSIFKDGCPTRVYQVKVKDPDIGTLNCSYSKKKKSIDPLGIYQMGEGKIKSGSENDKKNSGNSSSEEDTIDSCDDLGETLTLVKQTYNLIKYLIPIAIIVLSILDFLKTIVSGEEKVFKEVWNKLIKRVIIGIVILLLPAILSFVINLSGMFENNSNIEEDNIFCIFK